MVVYKKQCIILVMSALYAFLVPNRALACMPLTANDVFIARFDSIQTQSSTHSINVYDVKMKHVTFPFRSFKTWFTYAEPYQWASNFNIPNIRRDDLIIGLAYTSDGNKVHDYSVETLSLLKCQNDILFIEKPIVYFTAWDRSKGRCHDMSSHAVGLLDGFIEHDQVYYLKKLQEKYPTCNSLYSTFPQITPNHQTYWAQIHDIFIRIKTWLLNMIL